MGIPGVFPRQQGLSLIELLVAIAVWSIVLAGLITFVVNTNHNYRIQRSLNALNERGRYAVDLLFREMRMANHWGVGLRASDAFPTPAITNNCTVSDTAAEPGTLQGMAVFERGDISGGACTSTVNRRYPPRSGHGLLVRYADSDRLSDAEADTPAVLLVRARFGEPAELFRGGAVGAVATAFPAGPLAVDATRLGLANYVYRQSYYTPGTLNGETGLYRTALSGNSMVNAMAVKGVERVQFTLLVDEPVSTSQGSLQYLSPAQVDKLGVGGDPWQQVRGAYLEVLVRAGAKDISLSTAAADNTYQFTAPGRGSDNMQSHEVDAADRLHHRRIFSGSVQLRNARPDN